jgi:hypothetical protein
MVLEYDLIKLCTPSVMLYSLVLHCFQQHLADVSLGNFCICNKSYPSLAADCKSAVVKAFLYCQFLPIYC